MLKEQRSFYHWLIRWCFNCRSFGFGYFILWEQTEKTVSAHYQERNYCGKCIFIALCCCQIWCRGKLLKFNLLNGWLLLDLNSREKQLVTFSYKLSYFHLILFAIFRIWECWTYISWQIQFLYLIFIFLFFPINQYWEGEPVCRYFWGWKH